MTFCIAESANCQLAACRRVESTSRFHPLPGNRSQSFRSHSEVLAHRPGNGPLVCTNAVATRVSDKTNRTYPLWSAEIGQRVLRHPATGDNRCRRSPCLPREHIEHRRSICHLFASQVPVRSSRRRAANLRRITPHSKIDWLSRWTVAVYWSESLIT